MLNEPEDPSYAGLRRRRCPSDESRRLDQRSLAARDPQRSPVPPVAIQAGWVRVPGGLVRASGLQKLTRGSKSDHYPTTSAIGALAGGCITLLCWLPGTCDRKLWRWEIGCPLFDFVGREFLRVAREESRARPPPSRGWGAGGPGGFPVNSEGPRACNTPARRVACPPRPWPVAPPGLRRSVRCAPPC
jgi:hypothetical protein